MVYQASTTRYQTMEYRRCGRRAVCNYRPFPLACGITLAMKREWKPAGRCSCTLFDLGITHFDLANNYGPPPGSCVKATLAAF